MTNRKTVLLRGAESELGRPVAAALLARGATVALYDPADPARGAALAGDLAGLGLPGRVRDLAAGTTDRADPGAPFAALEADGARCDAVVHLYLPDAATDEDALFGHADVLRPMLGAALAHMERTGSPGIVVNQFLMPTLLADSPLAAAMVEARNRLTGITRAACVRYGKAGIRVTGLLVGLLDLPGLRALASPRVNAAKTPLGRWLNVEEVAGTLAFLTLDSGYMSGQMLVLDGGMTAGVNGV